MKKAAIINIGDELVMGQTINTNAAWLGQILVEYGVHVVFVQAIRDEKEEIILGLKDAGSRADYVFVSGGLGPTKDDITIKTITDFFGDELDFNQETYDRMEVIMSRYDREVTESQRDQCHLPSKARLFNNDRGTAPGLMMKQNEVRFFFTPGVPHETKHLISDRIMPLLEDEDNLRRHKTNVTLQLAGIAETHVEDAVLSIPKEFDDQISFSYLPSTGILRLRINLVKNIDPVEGEQILAWAKERVYQELGNFIFGEGDISLAEAIAEKLRKHNLTVATAESCTGGAIASAFVKEAGISDVFEGGVVAYSYDIKKSVLSVNNETLNTEGAVSQSCIEEMLKGALKVIKSDVVVAISGIAGPTGATPDKPVGTVFVGVSNGEETVVKRFIATKTRAINIKYFKNYALNLLRIFLERVYK